MKMLILSSALAISVALSAGGALAANGSDKSHDDGFDVFLQSHGHGTGHRTFLYGQEDYRDYRSYPRHYRYARPYYETERPYHNWWFW